MHISTSQCVYSGTLLQRNHWDQQFCPLQRGVPNCLSRNNKNGDRQLGHLINYYRSCKRLPLYFLESVYTSQQVFQECTIEIHVANCIPVEHGLYTQFTRPFPFLQNIIQQIAKVLQHTKQNGGKPQFTTYESDYLFHLSMQESGLHLVQLCEKYMQGSTTFSPYY